MSDPRRLIPSVDRLLETLPFRELQERFPRERVIGRLRAELDRARSRWRPADAPQLDTEHGRGTVVAQPPDALFWARAVGEALRREDAPSLLPVVNATGVVLHTNLGRAPLARAAREAMARAAEGYANLEYDLESGARGSRYDHCAPLLAELTGAEAGLVVNNNAAALLLALDTLARGRFVLVSRGELVEIGGSFRIPEIMGRSGATLHEVGSTNRTRVSDYRDALSPEVGAILKVHRSNFTMTGFTEEASLEELAELAREAGVTLLHDLGSGLLADPVRLGLPPEPRPRDSLARGAEVVVFSGDKLLGGPQAGLIAGRRGPVGRMRRNPLCRALRVDKVTLAGLEATLSLYRDPERALAEIPALALLSAPLASLEARARHLVERLRVASLEAEAGPGSSLVGGGTYPEVEIPSWTVRVDPAPLGADERARRLRLGRPPLVVRVEEGRVVLDLRTVFPEQDADVMAALASAWREAGP